MKIEFRTYCRMAAICLVALLAISAQPSLAAVTKTELAGHSLSQYPHFEYVKAINENNSVEVAIDPTRFPAIAGQTCDIYVVDAKTTLQWNTNQTLTDITTGGALTAAFSATNIQANTFTVTIPFELNGNAGLDLGVGYDVVLDCNQDGLLNGNDYIDGRNNESGFYVVHDTTTPGPLAVAQATYNLSGAVGTTYGIPGTHLAEDLFYPTNIASMGTLPLIVVSHGNGHNYAWYDHIGNHLASYGYIVMSHANNTVPGPFTASTTTLGHTDAFIDQVAAGVIAGGALTGHLDTGRIVWIGHSRGAEGVAIGYDRLFDVTYTPVNYVKANIKLISSMLPTDFNGTNVANPHDANYHLWTASGDADVNGSAGCDLCQTYHLHDRATGHRQSTTVQGTGHGWFHNGGGSGVFTGPCSIGPTSTLTHAIQLGHFLPLVKRYVDDNIPSIDFLTRQYESFRPMGVPTGNSCIVVSHEYRDGSVGAQKTVIIDDYQSQFGTGTSSIGAAVTFDVANLTENRLDDNNSDFTWTATDPFNGATQASATDSSRGVVFDWTGVNRFYEWEIPIAERNFTDNLLLSFRGAQGTQHPNTLAVLDDLTFDVTLRDGASTSSSINIGAFGGGLEQPYQRSGGWHNEMETIRIRLTDFLNNGSGLDLTDVVAVRLDLGPAHGSPEGRIVIDDVMLTNDRAVYDAGTNGDPHIKTVDGTHYDFQSVGEFTLLQEGSNMEIQARQTPVSGAPPITNAHTGLRSCVSINTAVSARVGGHEVSYQPNLSGKPDPSGLQLRINGVLTDIQAVQSVNLGSGGRVAKAATGNGIEVEFPNGTSLIASPHWWSSQSKWYLNLSVFNTPATEGVMGLIPAGDWLPALPDGSSLGSKPVSLSQRYIDLNQTFADAWRITDASSLFDYAPGTSTKTFTNREWPPEESEPCIVPDSPPVTPIDWDRAVEACRGIIDADNKTNCAFDVAATGEFGFVKAHLLTQKIDLESTRTDVYLSQDREGIMFVAVVKMKKTGAAIRAEKGQLIGTVQFTLNGRMVTEPVKLDATGQATWATRLDVGKYIVGAIFTPDKEIPLLPSTSLDKLFVIGKDK
jgi:hypothetical protein